MALYPTPATPRAPTTPAPIYVPMVDHPCERMRNSRESKTYLEFLLMLAKPARFLLLLRLYVSPPCKVRFDEIESDLLQFKKKESRIYLDEHSLRCYGIAGSVGPAGIDIVDSDQHIDRNRDHPLLTLTSSFESLLCFMALYPTPATPRAPRTAPPTYDSKESSIWRTQKWESWVSTPRTSSSFLCSLNQPGLFSSSCCWGGFPVKSD